jgi:hypothetical protein
VMEEMAPCSNGVVAKIAACSRDVKVRQQNWLLVGRGVMAELAPRLKVSEQTPKMALP